MMADLSKMTDEELNAMITKKQASSVSSLSDEELQMTLAAKLAEQAPVEDVMHPDITTGERLIAKNFGTSPTAWAAYLKQEHPDFDIKERDGQVLIRKPDEKSYKVLDPSNFELADIGDVGYDVLAGIGSGIATAAGGLAGAPSGPGALVTAGAAGGLASAGLEAGRQGLGSAFGIPENFSGQDIALAGGAGAVAPLLMGTGAGAKDLLRMGIKQSLKEGGARTAEELAAGYAKSQAGALPAALKFGTQKVAPFLGQMASGIDAQTLKTAAAKLPQIEAIEKEGVTDIVHAVHDDITGAINSAKSTVGEQIASQIDQAGGTVETAKILEPLQKLYTNLVEQSKGTPADEAKIKNVLAIIKKHFDGAPDQMSARQAFNLKQDLAELGDMASMREGSMLSSLSGQPYADKAVAHAARKSYDVINQQIDGIIGGNAALRSQYRFLDTLQKSLGPKFSTPERTYNLLRNLGGKARRATLEQLQQVDNVMGTNVVDQAKLLQAHSIFGKASTDALSLGGTTSTSRTLPLSILGGYLGSKATEDSHGPGRFVGAPLGFFLGAKAASPAALRAIMKLWRTGGNLAEKTKLPLGAISRGSPDIYPGQIPTPQAAADAAAFNYVTGWNDREHK